ncbi:segregation/condensation protein A [Corynebacterium sp. CCM 8835]|uniref:segregation and condensation protein A n=1 Tax=Corynebacterium antarcticum TaxID=2800405 RepID=UPI002002CAB3|nr:segregation/condensation protein A [Corynebacterium antarcticum]MCK7641320.1 segregation/condensation protein A [Corynebacterium antarcticum]MCK7660578.1 segregation/condensation protein A [Corynebacterium antarcticum]MCL0244551.1 segregation/condensation protein A [Corynebacterium antarcticum]MCX7490921.1 segregation/condensation protein A [Corynebacterium antarcticum]
MSRGIHASSATLGEQPEITGFRVALANFTGPFDLLLQLIGQKKLDVTEVSLSRVTDEFIAYTRALGETAELDEITEFLVVAATLLDLKTARLLPRGEVDSEEDLALLESRDLLFARLLQYRAYKQVAELFATWQRGAPRRYPRAVSLEERFAELLPPVTLGHTPASFAELAAGVFRPRVPELVGTDHIHKVAVSVPEQAGRILDTLRLAGAETWLTFAALTRDCTVSMEVVGRFLALLELYKAQAIGVEQEDALGELRIAWTGREVDPRVVAAGNWE